jgi:hypothetical protein
MPFPYRREEAIPTKELRPSPPAVAWVTRLDDQTLHDVYLLAEKVDDLVAEIRLKERQRIYRMGFLELVKEFWKGKKLYDKQNS